jgi:hypothetical protein
MVNSVWRERLVVSALRHRGSSSAAFVQAGGNAAGMAQNALFEPRLDGQLAGKIIVKTYANHQ